MLEPMFVTVHSSIGATVALALAPANPPLAFLIGWLGHFMMDAVPHGDEQSPEIAADPKRSLRQVAMMGTIDLSVLGSLSAWWLATHGWSWVFAAAVVGSVLPDVMWGFASVVKRPKMWGFIGYLHEIVHNPLKFVYPLYIGLPLQLVVAVPLWWRLLA